MNWKGVMPAITTCFNSDLSIDFHFMAEHCRWLLDNGCTGIVAVGSLGEGATLMYDEKLAILRTCVKAVHWRGPVVAAISALSTAEAVLLAKAAANLGCDGLMVLPPYVYQGDWREMKTHVAAVFNAKDDHFAEIFTDAVQNAVGGPACGPHASQVITQRLPHPIWLADQCRGQELDHRYGDWLGQLPGQGAARWRGKDEFVVADALAGHWRNWRMASTPRMTSPRA